VERASCGNDQSSVIFCSLRQETNGRAVVELGIEPGKPRLDNASIIILSQSTSNDIRLPQTILGISVRFGSRYPAINGTAVFRRSKVCRQFFPEDDSQFGDDLRK